MPGGEGNLLSRAHALFGGNAGQQSIGVPPGGSADLIDATGVAATAYRDAAVVRSAELTESRNTDDEVSRILSAANRDHRDAHRETGAVLAAARADSAVPANPIAARELRRRSII